MAGYAAEEPTRAEVDALAGPAVIEFGSPWCGHCARARPLIDRALAGRELRHVMVADGKGRRLGRSYGVKLWPTLVVLRDGREVARVVRPTDEGEIREALARLDG